MNNSLVNLYKNIVIKNRLFKNTKTSDTTRIVTILGIPVYKSEDNEQMKIQNILGNFICTEKLKSKIKEIKIFKIFGIPIVKRLVENDFCSYYFAGILIQRRHIADLFFINNLRNIKYDYDDVYIMYGNSGEIFLFFAYLAKAFLKKNNSQKPLFVATQKYHIDILKLYYPNAKYIYVDKLVLKTHNSVWKRAKHTYYILFSGQHFENVEVDIKNKKIGSVHYFKSILKTLNLTEEDFTVPEVFDDVNLQDELFEKLNDINLDLNNFIILAPEASTCIELPNTFWTKLANDLRSKKYDIYLNTINPANDISECKTLNLSYREMYFLALKAKAVISLRSGLTEFLIPTGILNIALYTKFKKRTKNAFSVDRGIQGFSMLKLPFVDNEKICEINTENFKNEGLLVNEVMNLLDKMLNNKTECLV